MATATATTAFAQDEDPCADPCATDDDDMGVEGDDDDDATGDDDDDAEASTTTAAEPAADGASSAWPVEIINRPLTLPKGAFSAGAKLGIASVSNGDLRTIGLDATGLWGVSYGVNDKLSVGVGYGIGIDPSSDGKGTVALNVAYTVYAQGKLIVTPAASAGYDLVAEGVAPLGLGALVWYNVTPKIAVILPPGQLNVALDGDVKPIFLTLPLSIGYQATPNVFATLDIGSLAVIKIKDAENGFFGADFAPVGVTGWYSPNNTMDIGVSVSTDLKNEPGDNLGLGLTFIYYGGV